MVKKPHPNKLQRAKPRDIFGKLKLLRRVRNPAGVYGVTWKVQCSCGSEPFTIREQYFFRKDNPKRDCGCSRRTLMTEHPREYSIWKMMTRRCYFPSHVSYEYYGAIGIRVCTEWRDRGYEVSPKANLRAFTAFFNHIGPAPSKHHTLDRINPHKNYEPGNVRWATYEEQANNKRSHWTKWHKASQKQEQE